MKKKSDATLHAAQILIEQRCPTQSVHCSYYGVLQLMCYKLANAIDDPISYEEQKALTRSKDSHELILDKIKNKIKDYKEERQFAQDFRDLKEKRKEADYTGRVFTLDEGVDCKSQAERLVSQLNRFIKTAS
ncbi:MAG: hypothetical protein K6B45_04670 [Bacteroidaceae bacterium]|nr:hypothetical protein [Bacteroidaceae bacterium]